MRDKNKTKEQLVEELQALRKQLSDQQEKAGRYEALTGRSLVGALNSAEHRLKYLLTSSPAVIYSCKHYDDYGATFVSDNVKFLLGYDVWDFIGNSRFWLENIHPDDARRIHDKVPLVIAKGHHCYEYRFRHKEGYFIWIYDNMRVVKDKEGNPLEIIGFWMDISKRKQLEESLNSRIDTEGLIAKILKKFVSFTTNEIDYGINWSLEVVGDSVGVDCISVFTSSGVGKKINITHHWAKKGIPASIDSFKVILEGRFSWAMDKLRRFEPICIPSVADLPRRASAEKKMFQEHCIKSIIIAPMVANQSLAGFVTLMSAEEREEWSEKSLVTASFMGKFIVCALERKHAEESLQEERRIFQVLCESSPVGIFKTDSEGNCIYVNSQWTTISGLTRKESLGRGWMQVIHPDDVARVRTLRKNAIRNQREISVEYRILPPNGNLRWVRVNAKPILSDKGDYSGNIGTVENITSKIKEDEERERIRLRGLAHQISLLQEQERRKIATALHDSVTQDLTLSYMKLQMMKEELSKYPVVQPLLSEVTSMTHKMIEDVRSLTFEISPPILYRLGLLPALEWFLENIQKKHGIRCNLKVSGKKKKIKEYSAIIIYQVVHELAMNVVKHAKAENLELTVLTREKEVRIAMRDDGVGFEFNALDSMNHEDFGLFSIQERLKHLEGNILINSEVGKGTSIVFTVPLD